MGFKTDLLWVFSNFYHARLRKEEVIPINYFANMIKKNFSEKIVRIRYASVFHICMIFFFTANTSFSQEINYSAQLQSLVSSNTPFWLLMNQSGKYSTQDFQPYGDLQFHSKFPISSMLIFHAGAEILAGKTTDYYNTTRFQQAYIGLHSPYLIFSIGKKEHEKREIDQLKSGDLIMSSNAAPIPIVQIKTPDYVALPFSKEHLKIKGLLAHGWFEAQRHVSNPYLHEKYLYLKVEDVFPINGYIGLHHAAMWGGVHPEHGQLPESWSVFKDIFFASMGSEDSSPIKNEQTNRVGNHIGSYDVGFIYHADKYTATLYRQTIFEDASGKGVQFIGDGLWGLEVLLNDQKALVTGVVLEFVKTTYQSGPTHDLTSDIRLFGNDNYYNNYLFTSGWSYHGHTLGNPFITSPILNIDSTLTTKNGETVVRQFSNNRVLAWHLGLMGNLQKDMTYKLLVSYALNYGRYRIGQYEGYERREEKKNGRTLVYYELPGLGQFSSMLEIAFPASIFNVPFQVKTRVAMDVGNFLGDRYGVFFSLSKSGFFEGL